MQTRKATKLYLPRNVARVRCQRRYHGTDGRGYKEGIVGDLHDRKLCGLLKTSRKRSCTVKSTAMMYSERTPATNYILSGKPRTGKE